MPRAAKPSASQMPSAVDPETGNLSRMLNVFISDRERAHLAELLALPLESHECELMCFAIKGILNEYLYELETIDRAPTENSKLRAISPLKKGLQSVIQAFEQLDWHTALDLSSFGFSYATSMPSMCDALQSLVLAENHYAKNAKPHRREGIALRSAMRALKHLANHYRRPRAKHWRYFADAVLTLQNIPHPDPDDQPSRYNELVKTTRKGNK